MFRIPDSQWIHHRPYCQRSELQKYHRHRDRKRSQREPVNQRNLTPPQKELVPPPLLQDVYLFDSDSVVFV